MSSLTGAGIPELMERLTEWTIFRHYFLRETETAYWAYSKAVISGTIFWEIELPVEPILRTQIPL